ncbi:MAG: rhomboid family intramembrane serine protease [Anaerolineales bacterium]
MFPIRDTIRSRSFPIGTYTLIAVNVFVFLLSISLGSNVFNQIVGVLGLVPAEITPARPFGLLTLVSAMFLHGGWFHLISNMWILFIFGDNVEDRMGRKRYLFFYMLSGIMAGVAYTSVITLFYGAGSTAFQTPTIGASGAIAGILGAYFVMYPRARVTTLIPLFIFPWFIDIPAALFIGVWFLSQLSSGLISLGAQVAFGGIAWWAHIGGFLVGVLLGRLFVPPTPKRPLLYAHPSPDGGVWYTIQQQDR